jgi:hypothetical protein
VRTTNLFLNLGGWVLGLCVDREFRSQFLCQCNLFRPEIDCRNMQPHGLGILDRDVAQPAST